MSGTADGLVVFGGRRDDDVNLDKVERISITLTGTYSTWEEVHAALCARSVANGEG